MFKIAEAVKITKPEKTIELYLEQEDDAIYLRGKDTDGSCWYIFRFNSDGTFFRCPSLPQNIGITLDNRCRIVEEDK